MASNADLAIVCDIGLFTSSRGLCNQTQTSLKKIGTLSPTEQELLRLRTRKADGDSIVLQEDDAMLICSSHLSHFISRYMHRHKFCVNSTELHGKKLTKSIRPVTLDTYMVFERKFNRQINPGDYICDRCRTAHLRERKPSDQTDPEENRPDEVELNDSRLSAVDSLNETCKTLDCSPMKLKGLTTNPTQYKHRKLDKIVDKLRSKFGEIDAAPTASASVESQAERDWNKLIADIKQKMSKSSYGEKLQLLTLVPVSWTYEKIMDEFSVTRHMVYRSKNLFATQGLLGTPARKRGKPLNQETENKILSIYTDQELTRELPGERNTISIKDEQGEKTYHQKHLLLMNVRELYHEYKVKYPDHPVSLSKFVSLRPKYCITVDSNDTTSVCVCMQHENAKLMTELVPLNDVDIKVLMEKAVCDITNPVCMIHRCDECPDVETVETYLSQAFESAGYDFNDKIRYTAWEQVDRSNIFTREDTVEEFCEKLSCRINQLTEHHYIAKHQSAALRTQKESLRSHEAIVIGDFAENYSFFVQNAIQGWHWVNSQATLHPFCIYYKDPENGIKHHSICVISNHMKHNTNTVYAFQSESLMKFIKENLPQVTKIKYFSDGCGGQYKNLKNFQNLCYHETDFGLQAEWNFFATSHGKGPCDGVGGVVKRQATRFSKQLMKSGKDRLLTAEQLYKYADENLNGIHMFYVSTENVEKYTEKLEERYLSAPKVCGSRNNHLFIPEGTKTLQVYRLSEISGLESVFAGYVVKAKGAEATDNTDTANVDIQVGMYSGVLYEGGFYVGIIMAYNQENDDYHVRFMRKSGDSETTFVWPKHDDTCWVPANHILGAIEPPSIQGTGRSYNIPQETINRLTTGWLVQNIV